MKSRLLLAVTAAVLLVPALAVVAAASEDAADQLPALERSLWEAWKNQDPKPFEAHLADNTLNLSADGGMTAGKDKAIDQIAKGDCKVTSYSLGDIATHRFGDSTIVLTYTADQDATCGGNQVTPKVRVSSVWVKQGDHWHAAVYHESPLKQ